MIAAVNGGFLPWRFHMEGRNYADCYARNIIMKAGEGRQHVRNVTPNFLRFKSKSALM